MILVNKEIQMYNSIFFYIISFIICLFLILTLFSKNLIYTLLSALCVFLSAAVLFLLAGSEYNAVIQLAIYGFAVPIIIGIGIMFTNLRKEEKPPQNKSYPKYIIILVSSLFILSFIYLVMTSLIITPDSLAVDNEIQTGTSIINNFRIFLNGIFIRYVWAFEIVSILLTIAAAGLTLIKFKGGENKNA